VLKRIAIIWLLMAAALTAQAQPSPTLRTALEAAVKAAEARRVEMMSTPAGKAFQEAMDVVRQLQSLQPKAEPKPEAKADPDK